MLVSITGAVTAPFIIPGGGGPESRVRAPFVMIFCCYLLAFEIKPDRSISWKTSTDDPQRDLDVGPEEDRRCVIWVSQ